jgi:hypothetical protein
VDTSTKYGGGTPGITLDDTQAVGLLLAVAFAIVEVVGLRKKLCCVSKVSGTLVAESDHRAFVRHPLYLRVQTRTNGHASLSIDSLVVL